MVSNGQLWMGDGQFNNLIGFNHFVSIFTKVCHKFETSK